MKDNRNELTGHTVPVTNARTGETHRVSPPTGRDERPKSAVSTGDSNASSPVEAPTEPRDTSTPLEVGKMSVGTSAVTKNSEAHAGKASRPADPQDLADYLAAVYAGRMKSLPEPVVKRLKTAEPLLEQVRRGELLRDAQTLDASLEKARLLMQLSRRPHVFPRLSREIREFVRVAVRQHPLVRQLDDPTQVMPGHNDGVTPEALWAQLTSERFSGPQPGTDVTDDENGASSGEPVKPKQRAQRTNTNADICSNVFWCDIFWRRSEGHLSFAETMRVLRVTVFALPTLSDTSDDDTIDALSVLAEKEDKRAALLFDWGHRASTTALEKVVHLERQVETYGARLDDAIERERALQASLEAAHTEGVQKDQALKAAHDESAVQKVHARADYEHLRADALGVIRAAVDELNNVDVALSRDVPKTAFARDVVHSVVDSLTRHIKSLDEKK